MLSSFSVGKTKVSQGQWRAMMGSIAADPKLTTRADCALISVCRVAAVVNRRSAQPAETDQI